MRGRGKVTNFSRGKTWIIGERVSAANVNQTYSIARK